MYEDYTKLSSDELFIRCVIKGADRAAVAGWPDFRRIDYLRGEY